MTRLTCGPATIRLDAEVTGAGRLLSAHLLGGHRPPSGFLPSGSGLRAVLSPNPDPCGCWTRRTRVPTWWSR